MVSKLRSVCVLSRIVEMVSKHTDASARTLTHSKDVIKLPIPVRKVLAPPKMKRKIGYGVSRGSAMEADVDENGDRLKKLRITDDNDDEHTNVSGAVGKSTESLYAQAMCT